MKILYSVTTINTKRDEVTNILILNINSHLECLRVPLSVWKWSEAQWH